MGLTRAFGLPGGTLALGLSMACSWAVHQRALRSECRCHGVRIRYVDPRSELPMLLNFVLPAALSGCVGGLALTGCNTLLVRYSGSYTEIALFSAAYTIRTMVLLAPNMVVAFSAPLLCNLRVAGGPHAYRQTFWTCLSVNGGLTLAAALLLFWLGPHLLALFGKEFVGNRWVLGLLLASAVVEAIAVMLYQPLYNRGKMWYQFAIGSAWPLAFLGGTWWTIARGGASLCAACYLAAWSLAAILYAIVARRLSHQEQQWREAVDPSSTTSFLMEVS